jgi:glycosyltransferase involved in cell wall biosynthesis
MSKPLTIWYISKYFAPGLVGSIGSRSWLILKHFAFKGNDVLVISSDSNHLGGIAVPKVNKDPLVQSLSGITIYWLKTYKYSVAKSTSRILSWLSFEINLLKLNKSKFKKPNIIVVSSLSLLTILNGIYLKNKYNCKLVFEVRDIWPLTLLEEGGYSRWNPLIIFLGMIEAWGYKKADLIVGTMPNLKEHVSNILGYAKKVCCFPMVYDKEMASATEDVAPEYLDKYIQVNKFNIVHAGTIGITNALDVFFEAASILKNNDEIRFVLVGDGSLKEGYMKKYSNLPNVFFAPKVGKTQVSAVLNKADLLYFSTFDSKVWEYGQSLNKVVDYMLSGKPILASYSGYPSMINEAECGFFVPAEDAEALALMILKVYGMSKSELELMGAKGRKWIMENRDYEKVSEQYLDELERL